MPNCVKSVRYPPMGLKISCSLVSSPTPDNFLSGGGKPQSLVMKNESKRKRNNKKNQKERKPRPGRKNTFFASAFGTEKEWSQSHRGKEQRTDNGETTRTKERDHQQQKRNNELRVKTQVQEGEGPDRVQSKVTTERNKETLCKRRQKKTPCSAPGTERDPLATRGGKVPRP